MQTSRTQIGDVTYNAATQHFETLVTFHTEGGQIRVAASVPAALSEDPESAKKRLWHDAAARRSDPRALCARLEAERADPSGQSGAQSQPVRRWFDALVGRDAA